ncbi:MAG: PqqD family protein [Fimbriimonadaceae bacterium]|nr:PqqD family protein [Fimbriimonadaceae bacterium]
MGLVTRLRGIVEGRRGPSAKTFRASKPMRNPVVTIAAQTDEGTVLECPVKEDRGWVGKLARVSKHPATKRFELEPVGAYVWELCDGKHTFEGIARKIGERFKMNRLEAETALAAFLRMLGQRGLITLKLPKS